MKPKYLKYSLEELIDDKQFISWALKGSNNSEWRKFIEENCEIKSKVKKAREIILLMRDTQEVMEEDDVLKIWQNIDQFDQLHKKQSRMIRLRKYVGWAASILLVLSLGTLGYIKIVEKNTDYNFSSTEKINESNDTRLVLSDGEEISLSSNSSTISLNNKNNELIIDNDSIIDLSQKGIESDKKVQMNKVVIPFGKKSELLLADGTIVYLNAGSRFAFPTKFTKRNREVFLEGEAYFEVAKSEKHPFIVKTKDIDIRVLGTCFDVCAYPADKNIGTVLLEGSVTVSNEKSFGLGKNEVLLKPNQKANFNKENNTFEVSDEPNAIRYIAWTEGWLQFSKENVFSVFNKLERYYNVEIRIPENFPSSELITGKLDLKESLEDVLKALGDVAEIEYRIDKDTVYIDKK